MQPQTTAAPNGRVRLAPEAAVPTRSGAAALKGEDAALRGWAATHRGGR
jgi:hypothetical protein